MSQQDINIEYERIFGVVHYPTLFDSDDVEYNKLRKEIVDTPQLFLSTEILPFEDIDDIHIEQGFESHSSQITYNTDINKIVKGIQNHTAKILTGILSLLGGGVQFNSIPHNILPSQYHNHIFWITKAGRCKAYGYFDKESGNFYIGEGSLISAVDDIDYMNTSSYRNRHRLIEKYGICTEHYVKVKKDVKCRTAVAAARYVLGATVNLDLWLDSNGKNLYEVYPEHFFR